MKLSLEKELPEFLSALKRNWKIVLLLAVGLLLVLLSGLGGKKSESPPAEEERVAEMCSLIDGVGECKVMMTYRPGSEEQEVYAVLVLCEGGESLQVREKITSLFCSLYGIGAHRVEIGRLCD